MFCLVGFAVGGYGLDIAPPIPKNTKINGNHQLKDTWHSQQPDRGTPEFWPHCCKMAKCVRLACWDSKIRWFPAVSQMFHVLPHRNQVADLQTNTYESKCAECGRYSNMLSEHIRTLPWFATQDLQTPFSLGVSHQSKTRSSCKPFGRQLQNFAVQHELKSTGGTQKTLGCPAQQGHAIGASKPLLWSGGYTMNHKAGSIYVWKLASQMHTNCWPSVFGSLQFWAS